VLILRRRKLSPRDPCGRSSLRDLLAAPGSAGVFGITKAARFPVVQAPLSRVFLCRRQAQISAGLDFLPSNRYSVPPRVVGAALVLAISSHGFLVQEVHFIRFLLMVSHVGLICCSVLFYRVKI
jgi:ABC-type molybdate transport system permease subunit